MILYKHLRYEDPQFKIIEICFYGYDPHYALYEKKRFLFFSWWSLNRYSVRLSSIYELMEKIRLQMHIK